MVIVTESSHGPRALPRRYRPSIEMVITRRSPLRWAFAGMVAAIAVLELRGQCQEASTRPVKRFASVPCWTVFCPAIRSAPGRSPTCVSTSTPPHTTATACSKAPEHLLGRRRGHEGARRVSDGCAITARPSLQ